MVESALLISAKVEGVEDGVHVAEDGEVEDVGIALYYLDTGVAEHLRDVLTLNNRYY